MNIKTNTMQRRAFLNARIIDPKNLVDIKGGVLIEGEKIIDIGPNLFTNTPPDDVQIIDCNEHCLLPGLVDIRAHLGEPGDEQKETLATSGRAATSGGVTTIVCLPNTNPVIDDMSGVEFVARRARKLGLAKVYPYGAVTKNLDGKEIAELGMLAEAGAVAFTDGFKPIENPAVLRKALSYAKTFDLIISQFPEVSQLSKDCSMNSGEIATRLGLIGNPPQSEVIMVERDIRLLEITGGKIHFANISTASSIEVIRRAKDRGLSVTCDTAPPYFSLNELAVGDYRTFAKLSPPLRSENDRQAVISGLKNGTIDVIASDHRPQDEEVKRLPFAEAAPGGVGLETLLPITLELVNNGDMSLLEALSFITCKPSALMGLPSGTLEIGAAADFALINLDRVWKVSEKTLNSKSKNSPFDGRPVQGQAITTVIDGRFVHGETPKVNSNDQ